jgi:hypothetical protein
MQSFVLIIMFIQSLVRTTSYSRGLSGRVGNAAHAKLRQADLSTSGSNWSWKQKSSALGANQISIPASDVAAVVGRNQYKAPSEVFNVLWKRYSPSTFTGVTKIDEQLEAFNRCDPQEKAMMTEAATYKAKDAADALLQLENATSIVSNTTSIPEEDKAKVIELLKTQVSTGHGTRTEDKVVDKVSEDTGVTFRRDTELYSFPLCKVGDTEYIVRGKIDRLIEEDGEIVLVEVKSRMKRLFHEVREYEMIQVQAYLQMLPGNIRRAKLIEQYMDETDEMYIERDDELWNTQIQPALVAFCMDLDKNMKQLEEVEEGENII